MKLEYRQHGQGGLCPRPQVFSHDRFLLLIVPWGQADTEHYVLHMIRDSFLSALHDPDRTQPFALLDCLSSTANQLLTSIKLANQAVYQSFNAEKYSMGFEVLAVAQHQQQWVVASSGGAGVFAVPAGSLRPISYGASLAHSKNIYLPSNVLGVHSSCHVQVQHYNFCKSERLLIAWHPRLPVEFLQAPSKGRLFLDDWHQHLARLQPEASFWLGLAEV